MGTETTKDPEACACEVSKDDMEKVLVRLEKVESQLAGSDIGSLESTVNDVLNGVTSMQQCISKMVLPGTETTKMPYESTKMPYESTKMEYDTTKMDYPKTTKMEYESTKMDYDTTKMDYETTMKAIETTMMKYDTTKMEYPETTKMMYDTTKMEYDTTKMEYQTTMMATTAEPIVPTEAYEMYGTLDTNPDHGNKCKYGNAYRAFKIGFTNLESCVRRCNEDANCKYATTELKSHCIGCKDVPTDKATGWYSYETFFFRSFLESNTTLNNFNFFTFELSYEY